LGSALLIAALEILLGALTTTMGQFGLLDASSSRLPGQNSSHYTGWRWTLHRITYGRATTYVRPIRWT